MNVPRTVVKVEQAGVESQLQWVYHKDEDRLSIYAPDGNVVTVTRVSDLEKCEESFVGRAGVHARARS